MIKKRIIIYGGGVNSGGGATLLNALLLGMPADQDVLVLACDSFLKKCIQRTEFKYRSYQNKFFPRLANELWFREHVFENDIVLFFGNIPPLFALKGTVFTFIQNRYLLDGEKFYGLSLKQIISVLIQQFFLKFFLKNSSFFIVQTESMRLQFLQKIKSCRPIFVWPFYSKNNLYGKDDEVGVKNIERFDKCFIYPASGVPHKNHLLLIDAWIFLAQKGVFPKLYITIDEVEFPILAQRIGEKVNTFNLNIENVGNVSSKDLEVFYKKSSALIFPSLFESFGLPLLEASQFGLSVIASELDYVRDLNCTVKESFDPTSSISIARAVLRFLNYKNTDFEILSPYEFYLKIINKVT
jgi:glycosyltransferase involved in cell wall biosynthesis